MADVKEQLRDAAHVAVGFGVLAFQRAQVRRQELRRHLDAGLEEARRRAGDLGEGFEGRLKVVEERLEGLAAQVGSALEGLEGRLPDPARDLVASARRAARAAAGGDGDRSP